jgi:diguanylate cyclase
LRRALDREEFVLHYQPKVNLESGEITGIEALVRWCQPDGELVQPAEFIPVAEDCGLILAIGRWVMREACTQAGPGRKPGSRPCPSP